MSEQTTSNVPTWFRVVGWVALVWNLLGVMNYIMQVTMSQEALNALPEGQRELMAARPSWVTGAFAIAVFAGALGCGALIMRKKLALPLLGLSLVAVVAQQIYFWFMSNALSFMSGAQLLPVLLVLPIAIYLVYLARSATEKGWLS